MVEQPRRAAEVCKENMKQPKDKKPKYEMRMTLLCTKPRRSIKLSGIAIPNTTGGSIGFYPIFIPTG